MVKVEQTFPAPASLAEEAQKATGSYREPDVIERLFQDFHNKCYICEIGNLWDAEVEHLLPHHKGKYPERKFDWDNLFLSCVHCNSVKNQPKYDVGIIDCCKDDLCRFRGSFGKPGISVCAAKGAGAFAARICIRSLQAQLHSRLSGSLPGTLCVHSIVKNTNITASNGEPSGFRPTPLTLFFSYAIISRKEARRMQAARPVRQREVILW